MDETDGRQAASRIEQLLEELRSLAPGPVWQRVEELVRRLVHLYGAGLERWGGHLREAGLFTDALAERMADDELLASLLLLHGVHPWPVERRVALALARPQLRAHLGGDVVLVAVEGDVARVRVEGARATDLAPERVIHRALSDAAPEIARVEVEGAPPPPARERPETLLQIRVPARAPGEAPR